MFALCCQLNQHIMRFAPLNVFWSKQLLLERHQPLDKCHSYSLKIPKAGEEKVKQASNVFGFKMEKSELAFIWILWFCSIMGFIFILPNNFPGYESHSVFAYEKANMAMYWTSWKPNKVSSRLTLIKMERRWSFNSTNNIHGWIVTFYWREMPFGKISMNFFAYWSGCLDVSA